MAAKGTSVQLVGEEKLLALLRRMPKIAQARRIWRGAARGAAKPVIKEAKSMIENANFGDSDEHLIRSLKYRNFSSKMFNGLGGFVNFDKKSISRTFSNPAKASVLINNRKVKPLKKTYKNWIQEATDRKGKESADMLAKAFSKAIEREIKRML